jgi:ribosomal protein S18 acetylase RimI-like enzyme
VAQVQDRWQPDPSLGDPVLDNPAWASLTGPHAHLAERNGCAARYLPDVSPFVAISSEDDAGVWDDLAALLGPGGTVLLTGLRGDPPQVWAVEGRGQGLQLVDTALQAEPDPDAVPLGASDVPEMLDLVARTQPGPFAPRTIELGTYLGIRRGGALVAMAGERLHPPGWTEISAVCTDAAYRGQGLATRLVRAVAWGIRQRGETPLLHTAATNTNAIRLYESIGFSLRRVTDFTALTVPAGGRRR